MLPHLWSALFITSIIASGALTHLQAAGKPVDDALRDSAQSVAAAACRSDDFNANNLHSGIWTFTDPLGNSALTLNGTGTSEAALALSLPAGVAHDLYTGKNYAPRVLQPCANTDFELEVKFDSPLSQLFQIQGILIQGDPNTLLRFDFSSDGASTNAYAASTSDGFATAPENRIALNPIAPNDVAPLYMRVSRTGNSWSMYSSTNGTTYTLIGTFTFAMTVTQAGLFAGNGGPSVPAHTALFDYFLDRAAPIDPEDGRPVVDTLPPLAYNVASITGGTAMRVSWRTDERARSRLQYGRTMSYGTTVIDDTLRTQHSVMLTGLRSNTLYHFRVISTDSLGRRDTTANFRDTTYVRNPTVLTVWYGNTQTFGKIGTPQPFVNVLGNATDPAGIDSLYYRLNGGAPVMLKWGPNARRLQRTGDFNIDLRYDELRRGSNTVVLTSKNPFNERQDQTITVRDSSGPVWPLPYSVTWSSAKSLSDSVQVVDGRWAVSSNKIHVVERGYDRNLGFGDTTWQDYVMTAKLSVSGFDSSLLAYSAPSNGPCIAFLMRWNGHTNNPIASPQPLEGYLPLGAFASLSWPSVSQQKWELFGNGLILKDAATSPMLEFNTAYIFKLQVTTIAGQGGFYRFKVWKASDAEPPTWLLNAQEALTAPQRGSALIVAHHVTASVDEVSFTPVPADAVPPLITNVLTEVSATSAYITFDTDEPARASVSYGHSSSYDSLAMSDTLLRLTHGIPLVGLTPNTNYHF
ncbi:MAG: hypothetical protein IT282_05190, partial [Bacteroidetes bacterium]|nr:hypothetical protein [Bacteroidota bacterium]